MPSAEREQIKDPRLPLLPTPISNEQQHKRTHTRTFLPPHQTNRYLSNNAWLRNCWMQLRRLRLRSGRLQLRKMCVAIPLLPPRMPRADALPIETPPLVHHEGGSFPLKHNTIRFDSTLLSLISRHTVSFDCLSLRPHMVHSTRCDTLSSPLFGSHCSC